jgi:hypothetical protein
VAQNYKRILLGILLFSIAYGIAVGQSDSSPAEKAKKAKPHAASRAWNFVASGDSRNCGNVVMPAIAAGAKKDHAAFYWHLGDLRAIHDADEDYLHEPEHRGQPVDMDLYHKDAWGDFAKNQISVFDPVPFFLGIGNHETTPPKTRAEFVTRFADWLDAPPLKQQRLADNPADLAPRTYYHWIQGGVDFIYLDSATRDQFDAEQLNWLEKVLQQGAARNPEVRSVVVGMHVALPESLARGHSMNDWELGTASGRQAYAYLQDFHRQTGKPVYILASHSHFYMRNIYDTPYWRSHGGVLPGWIVGTAGAFRYALPAGVPPSKRARTKVYGYLRATIHSNGRIDFTFRRVKRRDIPDAVQQTYTPDFVNWCFTNNADPSIP